MCLGCVEAHGYRREDVNLSLCLVRFWNEEDTLKFWLLGDLSVELHNPSAMKGNEIPAMVV